MIKIKKIKDIFTEPYYTAFEWFIMAGILVWLTITEKVTPIMTLLSYLIIISIIIRAYTKK